MGREKDAEARRVLKQYAGNLYISALTAHLVMHFGQTFVALPVLRQFLTDYTILPLTAEDFEWAFINIRNRDFEDALQLGVAIRHGCSQFVTFDEALFATYQSLPSIIVTKR